MSKKKKAKNNNQQNKQFIAEKKNDFFARLHTLLKAFGLGEYYKDFNNIALNAIYELRYHAPKVVAAPNTQLPAELIKELNSFIIYASKKERIKIIEPDIEISLYDFMTVGLSIMCLLPVIRSSDIKSIEHIRKVFEENKFIVVTGNSHPEILTEAHQRVEAFYKYFLFQHNSFESTIYWVRHLAVEMSEEERKRNIVEINKIIPPQKYFALNGKPRPTFRVVGANTNAGAVWLNLTHEQVGIQSDTPNKEMEVYIQKHALNRLSERLDMIHHGVLQNNICASLCTPQIITYKGKRLLEYYIKEHKAGYLLLEVQNNVVIIRTFLLLSNNGTPEGEKLQEITGLNKLDTQYLALDKISAFYSEDLKDNEKINSIIHQAGCESLLNIYDLNKDFLAENFSRSTAKLLEEYLKLTEEVESN